MMVASTRGILAFRLRKSTAGVRMAPKNAATTNQVMIRPRRWRVTTVTTVARPTSRTARMVRHGTCWREGGEAADMRLRVPTV